MAIINYTQKRKLTHVQVIVAYFLQWHQLCHRNEEDRNETSDCQRYDVSAPVGSHQQQQVTSYGGLTTQTGVQTYIGDTDTDTDRLIFLSLDT